MDPLVLQLDQALLSFDGHVIEAFGATQTANGRVHVQALDRLEVGRTRRGDYVQAHTVWRTTPFLVPFDEHRRADVERFVAAVGPRRG